MKKYKFLIVVQAILIFVSMFAGCAAKDTIDNDSLDEDSESTATESVISTPQSTAADDEETAAPDNTDSSENEANDKIQNDGVLKNLTAEKIATIDNSNIQTSAGGVTYKDASGKYGIISLDGKNDTGAKYAYCESEDDYFIVSSSLSTDSSNISSLNSYGLVDGNGKVIVPENYASIDVLNERYVKVCEVTGKTDDEDEALIYYSDSMFSISPQDGDLLFTGNWYVFDLVTGKKVSGATGTQSYYIYTYGNFVKYTNDDKDTFTVNEKGELLPEGAELLDNGCYTLKKGNQAALYNSDGEIIFEYERDGFEPYSVADDNYYYARKYENGKDYHALMDVKGEVVTTTFDDYIYVYGELILYNKTIVDFNGKEIISGKYSYVYYEDLFGGIWTLENDYGYTVIKRDGTVLYQGEESNDLSYDCDNLIISKKSEDYQYMTYSYADKSFSLNVDNENVPRVVSLEKSNNIYDLVDVVTGDVLIKGYENYSCVEVKGVGIYVYALGGDVIDIYVVS